MHKSFTRRLLSLALIVCALTMSAEKRSVYVLSDFSGWPPPTEDYADFYEQFKIYETSEGSNVYEGLVKNATSYHYSYHHFRFKTTLSSTTARFPWWHDNIAPFVDRVPCEENGSIVIARGAEYKAFAYLEPGTWRINGFNGCDSYRVRLDMNTGDVTVILPSAPMAVINAEKVPSPLHAANLISTSGGKRFVAGGPLSFYLYDYYKGVKYGAASPEAANLKENVCWLDKVVDGQPWTVDGWTGGVLAFSTNRVTLDCPDFPKEAPEVEIPDGLWLVGNFSGWMFEDANKMTADGDAFTGKLPAGTQEFKITNMKGWDGSNLGLYSTLSPAGSTYYYILSPNGNLPNISNPFPGQEVNVWFEPASMALALWPASAPDREGSVPSDLSYSIFEYNPTPGCLYMLDGTEPEIPTKENIKYLYRHLPTLYPDSDGWSGTVNLEEGASIRFINPETGQILCPGEENRTLKVGANVAHSSYTSLPAGQTGCWDVARGDRVDIKIKSAGTGYDALTVEYPKTLKCIYLVGTPNGWPSPTESSATLFENWKLEGTTDGGYYGFFHVPDAPLFRFYSSLSGWDIDSYGPAGGTDTDTPVEFDGAFVDSPDFSCALARTKDSFSFPNCTEGDMYIYVAPNLTSVTMSRNPIDVELGAADPDAGKIFYSIDNGAKLPVAPDHDGRYKFNVLRYDKEQELRVYSSLLGVDPAEPEHIGSYAYTVSPGDAALDNFDALGVAESRLGEVTGISAQDPGAFIIPARQPSEYNSSCLITIDPNSGKVYLDNRNYLVVSGDFNNNAAPTYENRADFYPYAVAMEQYSLLDIPAGQFDFSVVYLEGGNQATEDNTVEVVFDEDGIFDGSSIDLWTGLVSKRVQCPGWKGGKVLFRGPSVLADWSRINTISHWDDSEEWIDVKETSAGSKIFEFTASPTVISDTEVCLPMTIGHNTILRLRHLYTPTGLGYGNPHLALVEIADNKASVSLGCGYDILFNQINTDAKLKVKVDLNTFTADINVLDGVVNASYALFSDSESCSDENLQQSFTEPELVFGSVEVEPAAGEPMEFNLGSSNGFVMVPAGDKEVTFDESGFWTGEYATVQSTLQARRRTAALSDKWKLPEGFAGKLNISINQETRQITINAPAENKGYLLIPVTTNENGFLSSTLSASRLTDYARNAMTLDDDGNFRATVTDAQANGFIICKGIQLFSGYSSYYYICEGIFSRDTENPFIELDHADATADIATGYWATPGNSDGDIFRYSLPDGCRLKVIYDHANCELHLSAEESAGVEELEAADEGPVEYFNLQGIRIAKPLSGQICIRRQGAKADKIIVR